MRFPSDSCESIDCYSSSHRCPTKGSAFCPSRRPVPWEILRAAGYSPRLLEEEPCASPYADRFLEDVFEERIRVIFDRLCAAAWPEISLLVIPRTSEQEHKLYLYLREMERSFSTKLP